MEELTLLQKCFFEFIGTAIMILLGDGSVACTNLEGSKGKGGGWIVVTIAWGLAVMCGVFVAGPYSGAHLNPAVTIGLATAGKVCWSEVVGYVTAQLLGAVTGALLVYLMYRKHLEVTENADVKLGVFCTTPAIRDFRSNLISETIGTALLVFIILMLGEGYNRPWVHLGSISAFPVSMLIMAIGMSLGGTTGYAINPARDLGPRLVHQMMPITGKRDSDWSYAWIPVTGPIIGCLIAALLYRAIF